jgi:cytochrome c oxidase subunit 4
MNTTKPKQRSGYTTAVIVAVILAILTLVEFFVAINLPSAVLILLIALLKAVIVIWFFMHVYRLWRPEGSH